jgi:hypothetical protein
MIPSHMVYFKEELQSMIDRTSEACGHFNNEFYRGNLFSLLSVQKLSQDCTANEVTEISIEDAKLFVHNLGELLSQTREGIKSCELSDKGIVIITYKRTENKKEVNVSGDSYMAIIKEVVKSL